MLIHELLPLRLIRVLWSPRVRYPLRIDVQQARRLIDLAEDFLCLNVVNAAVRARIHSNWRGGLAKFRR